MSLSSISIERPVLAIVMSIVIVVFGILGFLNSMVFFLILFTM